MRETIARIGSLRIIPVVTLEHPTTVIALADALVAGGLPCIEVTFRTPAAGEALRLLSGRSDILTGAGSVLTVDQVKLALDAGVRFIVSAGVIPAVADYCRQRGILYTPGVCTPTDIATALNLGLDALKFFPAEAFGGLKTLTAIGSPYPSVTFIPTGGIHAGNLAAYLRCPKVLACGGTWIAEAALIRQNRFDDIMNNTRQAVAIAATCHPTT